MAEEKPVVETKTPPKVKISVDYQYGGGHGRWDKAFHICDNTGRELVLPQKEAVRLAKMIIRIAGEKA